MKLSTLAVLCVIALVSVLFWTSIPSDIYADPQLRTSDKNRIDHDTAYKQFTAANAQYELVTAITNRSHVIDYISVHTAISAAGDIYFVEGTTIVFPKTYLGETDELVRSKINIKFSEDEGIDISTSCEGEHNVYIEYHTE